MLITRILLYQMGQCKAALEAIDRAISLDANYSPAIVNRRALQAAILIMPNGWSTRAKTPILKTSVSPKSQND